MAGITPAPTFFWGQPDSLIDWCEVNFVHSPYIAEWYNTLSHVPAATYVLFAALVMALPRTVKFRSRVVSLGPLEWRHRVSLLGLSVVCTGSVLFHATLRYWAQLLDEIPMVIVVASLYFAVKRRHVPSTILGQRNTIADDAARYNRRFALVLVAVVLIDVVLYVWAKAYLFFVLSFIWGVLVIVYESGRLAIRGGPEDGQPATPERKRYLRSLLVKSVVSFLFAATCWFSERSFCPHETGGASRCAALFGSEQAFMCETIPYLHAIWHVFSVVGSYSLVLFLALATKPDGDECKERHEHGTVALHYGAVVV